MITLTKLGKKNPDILELYELYTRFKPEIEEAYSFFRPGYGTAKKFITTLSNAINPNQDDKQLSKDISQIVSSVKKLIDPFEISKGELSELEEISTKAYTSLKKAVDMPNDKNKKEADEKYNSLYKKLESITKTDNFSVLIRKKDGEYLSKGHKQIEKSMLIFALGISLSDKIVEKKEDSRFTKKDIKEINQDPYYKLILKSYNLTKERKHDRIIKMLDYVMQNY